MSRYDMPISTYMTSPVVSISEDRSLAEAQQILHDKGISCLAVRGAGRTVGLLSRTDLLRVGRVRSLVAGRPALLTLPDHPVSAAMTRDVVALRPAATVSTAARTMLLSRIHRVFVMEGDVLAGVFSTKDLLLAIRDARAPRLISSAMSTPAFAVARAAPLSLATDRLAQVRIRGLYVVDETGWPVGTFTQTEALAARDLPADAPVEEAMSYAMLCLDVRTPLYRAAGHAHTTRARRVLAVDGRRVSGVLTGLGFARAVSADA